MIQTRQYLESVFITNAHPTQQNFTDLIDSAAQQTDMDTLLPFITGDTASNTLTISADNVGISGTNITITSDNLIIDDGSLPTGDGYILTTDGSGVSSWEPPILTNLKDFYTPIGTIGSQQTIFFDWVISHTGKLSKYNQNYYGIFNGAIGSTMSLYFDISGGLGNTMSLLNTSILTPPNINTSWRIESNFMINLTNDVLFTSTTYFCNNTQFTNFATFSFLPGTYSVVLSGQSIFPSTPTNNDIVAEFGNILFIQ